MFTLAKLIEVVMKVHHTIAYDSSECSDVPYAATRAVDPRLRVTVGHMRV